MTQGGDIHRGRGWCALEAFLSVVTADGDQHCHEAFLPHVFGGRCWLLGRTQLGCERQHTFMWPLHPAWASASMAPRRPPKTKWVFMVF